MGELFKRVVPHTALPWTGERLTTAVSGQVEIEHLHRYAFARDLCRGLDVLDVASGEGYGTALLAQVAHTAVGVEIDPASVAHAQAAYGQANLRFLEGDARAIPLPDASVDAVVSFETIEHFFEHDTFIAEIRRVLRRGGRLIISSPERDIYSPGHAAPNPYHVRELNRGEFFELLRGAFPQVRLYAQRSFVGAALVADDGPSTPLLTIEQRGDTHFEASRGLSRPLYWVAIASDSPVPAPASVLYIDSAEVESLYGRLRLATTEAAALREQFETLRPEAEGWRRRLETLGEQAETWRQELLNRNADSEDLRHRLATLGEQAETWRQELLNRNADSEDLRHRLATLGEQAETWRQELLNRNVDREELHRRLATLDEQAETWRQELLRSNSEREDLHGQLARIANLGQCPTTVEGLVSALAASRDEFEARLAAAQTMAQSETIERAVLQAALTAAEHRVSVVYNSASWKLTGPLRGIATRHPGIARRLRRLPDHHPGVIRFAWRALRASWRLATLRRLAPPPPPPPVVELASPTLEPPAPAELPPSVTVALAPPPTAMKPRAHAPVADSRLWFFLGDTMEWLSAHAQLSGVGRVTTELFFAALREGKQTPLACALAASPAGMASLSVRDCVAFLAARGGNHDLGDFLASSTQASPPQPSFAPTPGDHVLFTGVVWTPDYVRLFRRLYAQGIRFSVLLYDIIPAEHPNYVSPAHRDMFLAWLDEVFALADTVFVSSRENRDKLLRWATLAETRLQARIVPIAFGANDPGQVPCREELKRRIAVAGVRVDNFVLSVGTIDRRKNQALLCRVWPRLQAALPAGAKPQLVLVGRDDIGLGSLSEEAAAMIEAGDILALEALDDDALAGLYRDSLCTVFPSLSEGYGLPVAESLAHGKLCIASDLPVIRDHAGDLPWYVPPGDESALLRALLRAVSDGPARAKAESRITSEYAPLDWTATWRAICDAVRTTPLQVSPTSFVVRRPDLPGIPRVELSPTLAKAQQWCTDAEPDVSILILNWNAVPLTLECVRHVWAKTEGRRYEILIIDNGSEPASLSPLRQLGPGVRLLELGINRFFGEANNIGAEKAVGRYLCLLNNDAFVQPGWLDTLVEALEQNEQAGAAGPLFLFPDGTVQEAGGSIDHHGSPVRAGRGQAEANQHFPPGEVEYISGATLLIRKDVFIEAGGFDLAYEPAYYEDADLCFKLRALRRPVLFCPTARVVHIEGAAAKEDPIAIQRRNALGDLNRGKFTARWSEFLESRTDEMLRRIAARVLPKSVELPPLAESAPTAAVFTPYTLTPGGGERFLLSIAAALSEDHQTTIVTPHPYSRLRLLDIGRELAIDLGRCRVATEAELLEGPAPDRFIAMGNHIVPPVTARGRDNLFICQFPFPLDAEEIRIGRERAGPYRMVITYSEYARAHVLAGLSAHQMPPWPVEVVYPPVPQHPSDPTSKRRMILTVGRFFLGGHSKRHDLLIDGFRLLTDRIGTDLEMHIVGSSIPDPPHLAYISSLQAKAANLPITFHVNASVEQLNQLYQHCMFYWHATGLETPLAERPAAAEHFGITLVEAMSASCVPMAFNAGGPREIIRHGVDGVLYDNLEELADSAATLLLPEMDGKRKAMGSAAAERAKNFQLERFRERIRNVIFS